MLMLVTGRGEVGPIKWESNQLISTKTMNYIELVMLLISMVSKKNDAIWRYWQQVKSRMQLTWTAPNQLVALTVPLLVLKIAQANGQRLL